METEPIDSPAAASCPRWVMLNRYGYRRDHSGIAETTLAAAAFPSTGRPFGVSFCLKAPPASSIFLYDREDQREDTFMEEVVAAHGDCLLLEKMLHRDDARSTSSTNWDYFLYEAGSAAWLPSLSLLAACFFPMDYERLKVQYPSFKTSQRLYRAIVAAGYLKHWAQLEVTGDHTAELCVLRLGRCHGWDLNQDVPIVRVTGEALPLSKAGEPMRWWHTDAVVPAGDRFLCWVDYFHSVLLCDMASDAASPKLLHMPLPMKSDNGGWPWPSFPGSRPDPRWSMNLGATGVAALRLVRVEPRCCSCCGPGETTCERGGRSGFTVTTWTLTLMMEDRRSMRWVEDGVIDGDELWASLNYEGVPRVTLKYPIVSSADPDVVCFMVSEDEYVYREGTKLWMVEVDTRSKALRSVVCEISDRWGEGYHLAAKLQC
ncbi:unnamed protein product [Urochloa decumbens]|uniref:DUF1618 domain-containing protein n=1 Tax=Urochloa decumbens TaxID=240449 RepID=A0ABC9B962_9POAL